MATQITVITGQGSTRYSVSTGGRGPQGVQGVPGSASDITASQISDSTAAGRALLTAATAAAQITALGAETAGAAAASQAHAIQRVNHTGTQAHTTITGLGTAATSNIGTTEGLIPVLATGGKLASSLLPSIAITETFSVANAAARLALTSVQAQGKIVIEADTGKSYGLVTAGNPATSGDWLQLGDRDINAADINDSTTAGRTLLTAPSAAAQITAIGAETPAGVAAQLASGTRPASFTTLAASAASTLAAVSGTEFRGTTGNRPGINTASSNVLVLIGGGFDVAGVGTPSNGITLRSDTKFGFSSGTNINITPDTFFTRSSAGVIGGPSLTLSGTLAATGATTLTSLTLSPPASTTPATNGQLTFEATTNTSLTIKLKGSDGIVRSVAQTLAPGSTTSNVAAADISDSTAAGRALLTAANTAAQITALGAETPAGAAAQIKKSAEKNLRGLKNAINTASASGDFPISIIQLGDSFSDFAQFHRSAAIVGSWKCGAATGGGDSGVTNVTGDYAKSPDGIYKSVASGGNLTCAHLLTGTQGKATHIYYTFLPGTGTAQLQWSNNGGAWTSVGSAINTASISANSVQVGAIALGSQQNLVRCRVTATGGTVNGWIGQGCDGPGLTVTQFGVTGQGVEQTGSIAENVWKNMVTGYKPTGGAQIIFVTYADPRFTVISGTSWPVGTEAWGASGPVQQLYTWSKTADSTCDWFVAGPHQVNPSLTDSPNATVDALYTALGISNSTNARVIDGSAAQREFAERNAEGFISCIDLFPTWALASAYYEDDIHVGALGEAYKRSYVWRNSNIGWILGDVGYNSQVRIGDVALRSTKLRSGAAALIGESLNGNGVLAPITMSQFRAGLPGQSEQAGVLMYCFSANVMRLANFGSPGISSPEYLELTSSGSTAIVRPVTTTAPGAASLSQLGASANRWGDIWTNGIVTGLVQVSANYTVTVTDHFIEVTANSPTVTLLNAAQNLGREYIIQNTGAGIVTMATTSSQTIGGFAPGVIAAGATLKVKSNGVNWLIIP